jgi:hypothetical protein
MGHLVAGQFERGCDDRPPFRLLELRDHILLTGPTRSRPPFILIANGPYSSIEQNASSSFNSDRIFLT